MFIKRFKRDYVFYDIDKIKADEIKIITENDYEKIKESFVGHNGNGSIGATLRARAFAAGEFGAGAVA